MIKTQQLPQEEVERFTKENNAFKTSVLVVAAVVLCFIPAILSMILFFAGIMKKGSASYSSMDPHDYHVELASKSTDLLLATRENEKICV